MNSTAPHSTEVERQARRVILTANFGRTDNPERLAAAYRVVARNRKAARVATYC